MAGGRPPKYSQKTAAKICLLLGEGKSLRKICEMRGMPHRDTVFQWLIDNDEFADQYARAKKQGMEAWAEEIVDIADDGSNDWMETNDPDNLAYRINGEAIQRSKLRVDTRKWIMSKLAPKKYGDHMDLTSGGEKIKVMPMYGGKSLDGDADTQAEENL